MIGINQPVCSGKTRRALLTHENPNEKKVCTRLINKAEQIKFRPYRCWNAELGMIATVGGVIIIPILL